MDRGSNTASEPEYRLLGPLEVVRGDRRISLGASRQRAILALLLLEANRTVATETIIEELWGDDPPRSPRAVVHVHISNLRKALTDGGSGSPIRTRPGGYVLEVSEQRVDLHRFEALERQAREAATSGRVSDAAAMLRDALALWRGSPLADVTEPFADRARARLSEAWATALEEYVDHELTLGRHADIVEQARIAIAAHPYRERLRAQLMVALYRSGRQAEALAEYHAARRILRDELGIEPSRSLVETEMAILRQDAAISAPSVDERRTESDGRPAVLPAADPGTTRTSGRWRISRPRAVAGIVLVAVVVGGGLWRVADRTMSTGPVRAGSLAVVDAVTGRIETTIPVGTEPTHVISADGSIWVTNQGDRTLSRIDPRTRSVSRTYGLEAVPRDVAAADGRVWVANGFSGTVSRLLVAEGVLSGGIALKPGIAGRVALAAEPGAVWAALTDRTVVLLDPRTGQVTSVVAGTGPVVAMALSPRAAWVIADDEPIVRRVDTREAVVTSSTQLRGKLVAVAVGAGSVWVAGANDNRLWRIDTTTGGVVATIGLPAPPTALTAGDGGVWVASGSTGTIFRIDTVTSTLTDTIRVSREVGGLTHAEGLLWVAVR